MLYLLGLADRVVGVSHECDYPPGVESLVRCERGPRVEPTRGLVLIRLDHQRPGFDADDVRIRLFRVQ